MDFGIRGSGFGVRGRRSASPGVVLIIAMMVAFVLSLVGVIVIEVARTDVATSGHVRRADQTEYVAETGLMLTLREWAMNYSIYRGFSTRQQLMDYKFDLAAYSVNPTDPRVFEAGSMGSPGSLGYTDLVPNFTVLVDRKYEFGESPGYSLSGTHGISFCFRRYTFTAAGDVGAGGMGPMTDSTMMMRGTAVIGPSECSL